MISWCRPIGSSGRNKMRGNHHHQLSLVLLKTRGTKQGTQNRKVTDKRQLADVILIIVCQEPGDSEGFPSRSSTVVRARRTVKPGTEMLKMITEVEW